MRYAIFVALGFAILNCNAQFPISPAQFPAPDGNPSDNCYGISVIAGFNSLTLVPLEIKPDCDGVNLQVLLQHVSTPMPLTYDRVQWVSLKVGGSAMTLNGITGTFIIQAFQGFSPVPNYVRFPYSEVPVVAVSQELPANDGFLAAPYAAPVFPAFLIGNSFAFAANLAGQTMAVFYQLSADGSSVVCYRGPDYGGTGRVWSNNWNVALPTGFDMTRQVYAHLTNLKSKVATGRLVYDPQARDAEDAITAICTADVKACPNGTFVGRTGSNCSFPPCPAVIQVRVKQKI